jgi:hypothetical protein
MVEIISFQNYIDRKISAFFHARTHTHKYTDFVVYAAVGLYVIKAYKWLTFLLTQMKLPEDFPYYFVYVSNVASETYKI